MQRQDPETGRRRKLLGKTAEKMLNLCHYKFREFMRHKAIMTGCELVAVTEEYTSMTCGHLNRKLAIFTTSSTNKHRTALHLCVQAFVASIERSMSTSKSPNFRHSLCIIASTGGLRCFTSFFARYTFIFV